MGRFNKSNNSQNRLYFRATTSLDTPRLSPKSEGIDIFDEDTFADTALITYDIKYVNS